MPTPTLLFVGARDGLGDPGDNEALKPQIKNLVHYEVIPEWNHLDFLYGVDAHKLLYPRLVNIMKQFSKRWLIRPDETLFFYTFLLYSYAVEN